MRKVLLSILFFAAYLNVDAQITITSADMPVVGDTLRHSSATALGFSINLNDVGANKVWNFDTLTPVSQKVDEYKKALKVSPLYGIISPSAYGYQVADTLGGLGSSPIPITVTEVYTFFNIRGSSPVDTYVAEGFGAKVSGLPTPALYDNEDELFLFPLAFGNKDTTDYYLNVSVPGLGRMVQEGERVTEVDAWGTITTPFFTTAKSCIRVRSEVNGNDSIIASGLPLPIPPVGIPRQTVDYYWLVQGEHYPALWITTTFTGSTETVTAVRYRDSYRMVSVDETNQSHIIENVTVYPNPAKDVLRLNTNAKQFVSEVFDIQGKLVLSGQNKVDVDVSLLSSGSYFIRLSSEAGISYASFVKK